MSSVTIVSTERKQSDQAHEVSYSGPDAPQAPLPSAAGSSADGRRVAAAPEEDGSCFPWLQGRKGGRGDRGVVGVSPPTAVRSAAPVASAFEEAVLATRPPEVPPSTAYEYDNLPMVQIKYGPEIHYAVQKILSLAEQTVYGTQYCFDDPVGCAVLQARLRAGVEVRLLLDYNQQKKPSCSHQHLRVNDLKEWGAMVKIHKPPAGGFASLHAKTWLCDGLVYLGGSCNFTRNSLTNNVENLVIVKSEREAQSYLNWFEELWQTSADA